MTEKNKGLQIARAIAALAVAYFHSKNVLVYSPKEATYPISFLMKNGFYGVDFFFSISGFVVCVIAARPSFSRADFLIRRIFRIYPIWIAACLAFWLVQRRFAIAPDTIEHIVKSFALLPTKNYPLLDVGWSLQHEVAFYAISALLIPVVGIRGLFVYLCLGALAFHTIPMPWWAAYFAEYYPAFAAGIVAYWLKDRFQINWIIPLALGALAFWLCTEFLNTPRLGFPIAFVLLLVGFTNMPVKSIVGRRFEKLGDASYSIYLLHPILFYQIYAMGGFPNAPAWSAEFIRFAAIVSVCLIAIVSYKIIEVRSNRLGRFLSTKPPRPSPAL